MSELADCPKRGGRLADVPRLALKTREAAEALAVSETTLRQLVRQEGLPCVRAGSLVLYSVAAIERWLIERSSTENHEHGTKKKTE